MGYITQTLHGIGGFGLEHFIQRRYESDKKNADELTASILLIADAMKRATPTMHEESATKRNLIANGIKTIIDSVDKTKESNTELNHWKYISSMASEKYEAIKKEGKVAIQTVIAQYGFTQDFSEIRNQVVALITSIDRIREEHPIVNDLYEKKSKKVIFVLGNVFKSEEKAEYILNCRINEELEHQKYANKPCGIYYIDNKKATEMLNNKGFELPRRFNLNGLVKNIQGESLIVKKK